MQALVKFLTFEDFLKRTVIKTYQKKDTLNLLENPVSRGTFEDILTSLNSRRVLVN